VLELKVPNGSDWQALQPMIHTLLLYLLSFVYLGIYWSNHHHMFHTTERVSGSVLWANLHLLFWLSLVPFVTRWMGENHFASFPAAVYGVVLFAAALAYTILQARIIHQQGPHSKLKAAVGRDLKGKISALLYAAAIPLAFLNRWISLAIYIAVALIWLVPDKRIESRLAHGE